MRRKAKGHLALDPREKKLERKLDEALHQTRNWIATYAHEMNVLKVTDVQHDEKKGIQIKSKKRCENG